MAFDILFQQVRAIAQVTQGFHGQVSAAFNRMAVGQMTSAVFGAQMMLGDALRLAAILEDTSYLDEMDFTPMDEVSPDNSGAMILVTKDLQAQYEEVDFLETMVSELEGALDLLAVQIGAIESLALSITHMANATERADSMFGETLNALEQTVLPEIRALQDRLEEMLEHYRQALYNSQGNLHYLETVFKFILPYCRALKERRQRQLKEAQEGEEKAELEQPDKDILDEAVKQALKERKDKLPAKDKANLTKAAQKLKKLDQQADPELKKDKDSKKS